MLNNGNTRRVIGEIKRGHDGLDVVATDRLSGRGLGGLAKAREQTDDTLVERGRRSKELLRHDGVAKVGFTHRLLHRNQFVSHQDPLAEPNVPTSAIVVELFPDWAAGNLVVPVTKSDG